MIVSIIICTKNRCEDLRLTLEAISRLAFPQGLDCELLLVDNASQDGTAALVKSFHAPGYGIQYLHEERRGKSHGLNQALEQARGDILLFTDDDVRPHENWISGMSAPIMEDRVDALAGGVLLAPELERPWMTPLHRAWLAASLRLNPHQPEHMIGANMSCSRKVLAKVPGFDPELGPGVTGGGDDTLFSLQLKQAGYRIGAALDITVTHHFEPFRLDRRHWLQAAENHGRTEAYLQHHWFHDSMKMVRLRYWKALVSLKWYRANHQAVDAEGCSTVELRLHATAVAHKSLLAERKRPRNYTRKGLVKNGARPEPDTRPRKMAGHGATT